MLVGERLQSSKITWESSESVSKNFMEFYMEQITLKHNLNLLKVPQKTPTNVLIFLQPKPIPPSEECQLKRQKWII